MADNEVMVSQKSEIIPTVDMAVINEYMDSTGLTSSLEPKEKAMFINIAREFGLNPFKREIYCTAYGKGEYRKCAIVTGYEVYIKRAERTGKLDGWHIDVNGKLSDRTLSATITIYRKDWSHEFKHTVYYCECVQTNKDGNPNAVWAKQPIFMTKKVAAAQGFRMCFSDEFGGMPYTNDELGVEDKPQERNITPEKDLLLESLLTEKKELFKPNDWERANKCLKEGTAEDILKMYEWARKYVDWAEGGIQ